MGNADNNNQPTLRLLVLEKSSNRAEHWVKLMRNAGLPARIQWLQTLEELEESLSGSVWDIMLTVEETPLLTAQQALSAIQRLQLDIPLLVSLAKPDLDQSAYWLEKGAHDTIYAQNENLAVQVLLREKSALDNRRELLRLTKDLEEAEHRCQRLMESASQAIAFVHEGMHVDANEEYLKLFGYADADDLAGMPLIDMIAGNDQGAVKSLMKGVLNGAESSVIRCSFSDASGNGFSGELTLSNTYFDGEACIQVLVNSMATAGDSNSSDNDLVAREAFMTLLNEGQPPRILAYIQLDNYDHIRTESGITGSLATHTAMIRLLSEHLQESPVTHFCDEVYLAALDHSESEKAIDSLDDLRKAIENELIQSNEHTLYTSVSIGLAGTHQADSVDQLLPLAGIASEMIRKEGGNRVEVYSQSAVNARRADSGDTQAIIAQALDGNGFLLFFQPVISITGDGDKYYEVLLRLRSPQGGEVPAGEFIPTAQAGGLMPDIDRWVVRQSIAGLARKRQEGEDVRLMIHISGETLADGKFPAYLVQLLDAARLTSDLVTLQISEKDVHQRLKQAIAFTSKVQSLGGKISLIQFAGETLSLKILQHLAVDFIKLDSRYSRALDGKSSNQLKSLLSKLAKLDSNTIMPGVEDAQMMTNLWQLGVDYAQGYYLEQPMDAMEYDFDS
ncbi:MAG: EAL domain-containing protein [Endozoicomonas sp.]